MLKWSLVGVECWADVLSLFSVPSSPSPDSCFCPTRCWSSSHRPREFNMTWENASCYNDISVKAWLFFLLIFSLFFLWYCLSFPAVHSPGSNIGGFADFSSIAATASLPGMCGTRSSKHPWQKQSPEIYMCDLCCHNQFFYLAQIVGTLVIDNCRGDYCDRNKSLTF